MTREEAIRQIENRWSIMDYGESEALGEALDMAIEALTSQNLSEPNNTCEVDLISREVAIDTVCEECEWERKCHEECQHIETLKTLPSADAVEVVRCKDCKHYSVEGKTTRFGWCNALEMPTDEMRYCSDGESEVIE